MLPIMGNAGPCTDTTPHHRLVAQLSWYPRALMTDASRFEDDERRLTLHARLRNKPDPPLQRHEHSIGDHDELPRERRKPAAQWKARPLAPDLKNLNYSQSLCRFFLSLKITTRPFMFIILWYAFESINCDIQFQWTYNTGYKYVKINKNKY